MRGMNMREMKARQQGKAPRITRETVAKDEQPPAMEPEDEEPEETLDAGALVDQGDGVRVARGRRRANDEERCHDLPDEPPPGWLGEE